MTACGLLPATHARAEQAQQAAPPAPELQFPARKPLRDAPVCLQQIPSTWPTSLTERRALVARLKAMLAICIDEPEFLSVLGALLLEDSDAAQALLWLERALLLDPGNLGAQADHALALAELGEPEALRELTRQWRNRTDLPAALRARLYLSETVRLTALPAVKFGQPARLPGPAWGFLGELSLMAGHESNLDRSPRLTELTLTIPDGPFVLPVESVPRKGSAGLGSASLQGAYSPWPSTVLRSTLNLNARRAEAERSTDWHQAQWALEWLQRGEGWRTQLDAAASWIGGPLSEAYRLQRVAASVEIIPAACAARAAVIGEQRTQSVTHALDAKSAVWVAGLLCPLPATATWTVSLSVNYGRDTPDSSERPGGRQLLSTHLLRLVGTVGTDTVIDLSQRNGFVRDAEGYSALLENNAVRRVTLRQTSLEIAQPLRRLGWPGTTAVLQWQTARQSSNLKLFQYRADSVYGGLRWTW